MRLVWGLVACALSCSPFDAEPEDASPPPNQPALEGGAPAPAEAGTKRTCVVPAPANTKCWDFDDAAEPGGEVERGSLSLDRATAYSPSASLLATTEALPTRSWGHARLSHLWATPPKSFTLDERIRLDDVVHAKLFDFRISAAQLPTTFFGLAIEASTTGLNVRTGFFVDETSRRHAVFALGSVSPGSWTHLEVRTELKDHPGPNARLRLVITIDGSAKLDTILGEDLPSFAAGQTVVTTGLAYVDAYGGAVPAQRMHLDDVLMSWSSP